VTAVGDNGFKDHFSGHSAAYARHRPGYPESLYTWLAAVAPGHGLAWDAGTGNGQAATALAGKFRQVYATDASASQIGQAPRHPAVRFRVEPAEHCSLADASADLVTVGQALHWFNLDGFYAEVRRVLVPGGLLAAWTYTLCEVDVAIDAVVRELHGAIVGPYWPAERIHVDRAYQDLPFPWEEIVTPELVLERGLNLAGYLDYLRSWSAVQRYLADRGEDPLDRVAASLADAWGDPRTVRRIRWPLVIRAGFKPREN